MADLVESILTANRRIKAVDGGVRETPLDEAGVFSEQTGAAILFKCEHLQRTGSFKLRGALNRILSLRDEGRSGSVVAASSGNHGIAAAQAARGVGVKASIYLPRSVSPVKLANMKRLGAQTVVVDGNYAESERAAREAAKHHGKTFLSPYSDRDVIAGQGTIGLELAEQCPDLAAIFACVGGGALIGGIGSYFKARFPKVEIIACHAENASAMYQCLEKGRIFQVPEQETFSDGSAGAIEDGAITFPICQQVIDRHVLVSEREIAKAMREVAVHERFIIEGSAGVAVAAALKTASDYRGAKVGVVICGRNVSLDTFRKALKLAS